MKSLTAALLLCAPLCAFAQTTTTAEPAPATKVTVTSRGNDIRIILTNIFTQAKKSFILQQNIEYSLYLSLQDTDFQKAIDVICEQAGLKYDIRDDIYHIYKKKAAAPVPATTTTPAETTKVPVQTSKNPLPTEPPMIASKKPGRLPITVFKKKITTKLAKAPIGAVLEEIGAQAGVTIELGDNVPAYRMDAILNNVSLRYALEQVTRAAKLTYTLTDHHSILIEAHA